MYFIVRCQYPLTALAILVFLVSANALFFTPHAVEEMQGTFCGLISYPSANPENPHCANHDHAQVDGDAQSGAAPHGDCCSSHAPHSHDLVDVPAPALVSAVVVYFLTFPEPATYIPEVFLERFVPPQNLA